MVAWQTCFQQGRIFLSTPSARRATYASASLSVLQWNFYPRPPRGGRRCSHLRHFRTAEFLSTPSARRATNVTTLNYPKIIISIHALREEGDRPRQRQHRQGPISIHALREEGDLRSSHRCRRSPGISIHALREEGDDTSPKNTITDEISIHALREEGDRTHTGRGFLNTYFYPRPPRGGRQSQQRYISNSKNFYPRPPRGGRPCLPYFSSKR